MPAIQITSQFAWSALTACGMALHCIITGGKVSAARKKYQIDYPDMGNGRLSKKLTDDQWRDFMNHQRAHQNYVEGLAAGITLELIAGFFQPMYAACLGVLYMVGREVYSQGYIRNGAKGRLPGAIMLNLALLGWLVIAVSGCVGVLRQ